ncbi:MAG: glycerol-3-phosphate 1-O-acyltransferase PlsY [Clostridia bacterium]|nr:glycerol-3-phosphate 1-O-acyltransferase PlsY [Clostridia bacterium]
MNRPVLLFVSCIVAYLIGSVSTGILVSRWFHGPDLRSVGSKNTGASNVQRTMGWKYGLITFVGDMLKGILSCAIAEWLTGDHLAALPAGLCAVIGHNWPVFFHFKGGKGVSTSTGVMLWCFPVPALISMGVTVIVIALTKWISLGSLALVTLYALLVSIFFSGGNPWVIGWSILIALLCYIRHRANIRRLIAGTENKLGNKIT